MKNIYSMNQYRSILVTGANGQLGTSLQFAIDERGWDKRLFHFTDIDTLDITNAIEVNEFCDKHQVDAIINLAAYTQVDKAESDRETAFAINAGAVEILSLCAQRRNAFMVQISTDYVFNGSASTPYCVDDKVDPVSAYGESKAEGERFVLQNVQKAAIIRTAWLYSAYGNNFFKTMMRLGAEKEMLNVVNDQIGCPTYAPDLAEAILTVLEHAEKIEKVEIFHFTNEGAISWYDFASKIMELGKRHCHVNPIASKDYPTPTKRPAYSVLDLTKIKEFFGISIPAWEDGLNRCILTFNSL
ncbi:MAG: dTDP-4-dehydrorhamnose reductase [Bacteroidales bacterium]|nr:dTDP-4-dehydrorhamnose reductase [Bacteroidales bacterium]